MQGFRKHRFLIFCFRGLVGECETSGRVDAGLDGVGLVLEHVWGKREL